MDEYLRTRILPSMRIESCSYSQTLTVAFCENALESVRQWSVVGQCCALREGGSGEGNGIDGRVPFKVNRCNENAV